MQQQELRRVKLFKLIAFKQVLTQCEGNELILDQCPEECNYDIVSTLSWTGTRQYRAEHYTPSSLAPRKYPLRCHLQLRFRSADDWVQLTHDQFVFVSQFFEISQQ